MQPWLDAETNNVSALFYTFEGGGMDSCCNGLFLNMFLFFFFATGENQNSIVTLQRFFLFFF